MSKCEHNKYWTGIYGTCMACRANKLESALLESRAENERLKAVAEKMAEALKEITWYVGVAISREGPREGYARIDGKAHEALAAYAALKGEEKS